MFITAKGGTNLAIQLGIRAHDLNATSLDKLLEQASKFEFSHFHFAPKKLPYLHAADKVLTPGLVSSWRHQIQRQHFTVSILGCYINLVHPDPQIREASLRTFENYLSMARYLGPTIVATETGSVLPSGYTEQNFTEQAFMAAVDSIKRLTRTAERLGALIAIEPGNNHPICDLDRTRRLVAAVNSPNLKLICDPVNLITADNYQEQDHLIHTFMSEFADRIVAFHLKDFTIQDHQCQVVPFGQGQFSRKLFLTQIEKQFPHAYCSFEAIHPQDIPSAITEVSRWTKLDPRL